MNPLAARLLQRVYAATAEAVGDNLPDDPAPAVREVVCPPPHRVEPAYVTAFEARFRRKAAADEGLVLESLAVETAARGPWEAARFLFTP
ncbi:hypothetical protein AB0C10_37480 [Microbispora amethystogenes]|uniref:hypothetical protein n=1 Tax=Microbispora amethystogenes TaxID=1427754 RepID=UPI0033DDDEF3